MNWTYIDMKQDSININKDGYLIAERYHQGRYKIDLSTYEYIQDLVRFYHESMYLLPDDERVEVTCVDHENLGARKILKINEIVFV